MADDLIPLEIQAHDKQAVRNYSTLPSFISIVQRNVVQNNYLRELELQKSSDQTHVNVTSPHEQQPLTKSFFQNTGNSQYFREDSRKMSEIEFDPLSSKYKTKPHDVHFRTGKFIQYFLLRILFIMIGPLILTYGLINSEWLNFMKNMCFYRIHKGTIYNYIRFIYNYIMISMIIISGVNYVYEMILVFLIILTECIVVAIKFAFFHPSKLELIEKYDLCQIGNSCEQSLDPRAWAYQCPYMVNVEVEQSSKRLQVEMETFLVFFMVNPSEERKNRIQHKFDKEFDYHKEKFAANGQLMVKEVLEYYNKQDPFTNYVVISLVISILRVLGIILLEYLYFFNQTVLFITILSKILQTVYFTILLSFLFLALRDLQRKVFCMTQLSHLISGQKVEAYEETKLFPTLNLLCVVSMFSWVTMRKIFLDYGLQYTRRQSFMMSFIIISNLLVMLTCSILFYLNYIDGQVQIQVSIDFVIVIVLATLIVLQGARINNHTAIHKGLLRKNMFIIQQLCIQEFNNLEYSFVPTDFVFKALSEIVKMARKGPIQDEQFQQYIMFCINSIKNVYDDLTFQEQNQPYTVMGIAMTEQLVLQIGVSAGGLVGTCLFNYLFQE